MNPTLDRYRYWVAAAVAGLTVALAILLRGFVREFVVIPIVQFLWLINLYLRGIPQPLVWGLFLAVASYVALNSFSKTQRKRRGGEEVAMQYLGPVESELKWIRLASYGSYGRWRLAQRLAGLLAKALAQHYRMTEAEAKRALQAGRWELPPEIRAYVLMGLGAPESRPPIIRLLRPRSRPQGDLNASDPNAVMDFIEAKLEELYVR